MIVAMKKILRQIAQNVIQINIEFLMVQLLQNVFVILDISMMD